MNAVLDSSAVLAFLQDERGAKRVEQELISGAIVGAANWSEVAQKVRSVDVWSLASGVLSSYGLVVEPVVQVDAERAAAIWVAGDGLSLADRLCLALAERLDCSVLTADRSWGTSSRVVQIR